jgi:hypothetical protein
MPWYYIPYFASLSGTTLIFINKVHLRSFFQRYGFIVLACFLIIFAGLRAPNVDGDYNNYLEWFNGIAAGNLTAADWLKDPAFDLISLVIASIGWSYVGVTLVYAAISITTKIYFSRLVFENSRWIGLLFYLIFCRTFIRHEMTQTRAGVAIGLMSASVILAVKKEKRKSLLLFILSLTFHLSTIIGLPLLILASSRDVIKSRLWIFSLFPIALLLKVLLQGLLGALTNLERLAPYLNGSYSVEKVHLFSAYFFIRIFVLMLVTIGFWRRLSHLERLVTFAAGLGLMLLIALSANDALALRCADIFGLFELVMFVIPLNHIRGNLRLIYAFFIAIIGLGFFLSSLELIDPYQWIMSSTL